MRGIWEYIWIILLFSLPLNIVCDKKKDKKSCPGSNYAQLSDTCYYFYYDSKSWWEAQNFCEGNGGTLLIFQERNEIKLIKKEIKKIAKKIDDTTRFWLGLKHNEDDNEFYWADGTDLTRKGWENKLDDKVTTPGNCVVMQTTANSGAGAKKWETRPCTDSLPYVCEIDLSTSRWTVWGKWNDCSVTCGRGTRKRFRRCLQPTSASKPCEGSTSNTVTCSSGACPVTRWSKWSSWGDCSVTCGRGTQTRSRTCSGSGCSGKSQDTKECNKSNCPVWSKWSDWTDCSVTCGTGQKQRTRRCLNSRNNNDCKGNDKETEKCSTASCPDWGKWSDWTSCSVTCGTGQKQRTRRCLNSRNNNDCKGNDKETEKCSTASCPDWGKWSDWTDCSVTCGTGQKQRTRRCLNSRNNNDCKGNDKETEKCSTASCPVWSKWSDWTGCSVTCGTGQKQRTRRCLNSRNNNDCKGNDKETEKCSTASCPDWGKWSDWTGCSVTCGTGQKQRTRRCLNSRNNNDCKGNDKETEKCSTASCPVWSKWSDWTSCSVTCGTGQKQRTRRCLNSRNNNDCKGNNKETEKCSTASCPVWNKWSDWTGCSVTCGTGQKQRTRRCLNSRNNNDCKGKDKETEKCSTASCPVWSKWSVWTDCSVTCGTGQKQRTRRCLNSRNNNDCKGKDKETEKCSTASCPDWGKWSDWTGCSVTCGTGQKQRTRRCLNSRNNNDCKGNDKETEKCSTASCPDWGKWSDWTGCSVTCGTGQKQRTRRCLNSRNNNDCKGNDKETEKCSTASCPVWSKWSDWTSCSVTCGTGQKQRTRRCLNSRNNNDCKGNDKETEKCSTASCPVWNKWSDWTGCSVTCGTGQKQRTRRCLNSRNNNDCKGKDKETEKCSTASCPVWSKWSVWTDCSVTCGTGQKQRTRRCLNSRNNNDCKGKDKETEKCSTASCPDWGKWSDWTGCSVTCGTGQKQRTRRCLNSRNNNDCKGNDKETEKCSTASCPDWGKWSDWTGCSVTCGTGQKQRTRRCLNSRNNKDCKGNDKETEKCSTASCPVWSKWSDWTGCSVTCGTGQKQRTRRCLNSRNNKDCKGNDKETEKCSTVECPDWSKWSDWTGCSVTCGEGTSTRSRTCLNSKKKNECKGKSEESKSCSEEKCLGCSVTCGKGTSTRSRTCLNSKKKNECKGKSQESKLCSEVKCLVSEWSTWSDWTGCSVTCGKGTSTRSRTCLNSKKKNECKGKSQEKQTCVKSECQDTKKSKKKKMRNRVISARKTKNKGIVGYEIVRTITDRAVKCALYCLRYDTCRSFNYEFRKKTKKKTDKYNRICVLNTVSLSDQPSALEAMPGFRLYDMGLFFDSE